MTHSPDGGEAALIVTRVVTKGREDTYRDWAARVLASAQAAPGHRGTVTLDQSGGFFHVVQRFESRAALAGWQKGEEYRRLMAQGDAFSTSRRETAEGTVINACLPSDADSAKWKRFLMTWAAVLPLVVLLNIGLHALPVTLPPAVQSAISSCVMVAAMTWLILPAVSRRLKPWVLKGGDGKARAGGDT